jgi:tetrahydromethanopterin S-methyltransferase subunit F
MSSKKISVTLTREDMIRDLLPLVVKSIQDKAEFMVRDERYDSGIPNGHNIDSNLHGILSGREERDEELINLWCELCSIQYFDTHVVDDVLLAKREGKEGYNHAKKEWVASR